MIRNKTFFTKSKLPAKKNSELPDELFVDCDTINWFIDEVGSDRIVSIAARDPNSYTIFYEADGLLTCLDCDQDHASDQSFCHFCGKSLVPIQKPTTPICSNCGQSLLPVAKCCKLLFCAYCGQRQPEQPKKKGLFD